MTRFRIEESFWALYPEARLGIVLAQGIDNRTPQEDVAARLGEVATEASRLLGEDDLTSHPAVAPWRDAYRAFGAKPSKYRSSIESLLRSARAGRVGSVNPLVDLYNTISLKHHLPCGGEDLASVKGDIRLTRATGGEPFVPLGAPAPDPPVPGEVIYRDDEGVLCRCWNWREAERTKLTADTRNAFLCIEALPSLGETVLRAACEELASLVRERLGGGAAVELLHRGRPEIAWNAND